MDDLLTWDVIVKLGFICAVIFGVQLALCIKASKIMTKLWPVIILSGLELVCLIIVLLVGLRSDTATVISSFAASQLLILSPLLVLVNLAWLVYGVIVLIKKLINKPEV